MKQLLLILLILIALPAMASQKAITDTGEEVLLHPDGTWSYIDESKAKREKLKTNPTPFTKPGDAFFLVKSTVNNTGYWIDATKWGFEKAVSNKAAEYEFQLRGKDLYGLVITEEIIIPMESLVDIALENMRDMAPDAHITLKEYREVNGLKLIHLILKATYNGINVVYKGYYYSNERGTTQLITYTSQELSGKYEKEAYAFLNGLSVVE